MRDKGHDTNWQRDPTALNEVEHVEVDGEIVPSVTTGDVVEIGLLDEFLSIPGIIKDLC